MRLARTALAIGTLLLAVPLTAQSARPDLAALQSQVRDAERAFAKSMADRDHAKFTSMLADEAVFFAGPQAQRGKSVIAAAWKAFYEGPSAPFSWEPTDVEVLESGTLAISSGPVRDPSGKRTGTYNSVWRLESPGVWKIIFDKGCPRLPCDCAK